MFPGRGVESAFLKELAKKVVRVVENSAFWKILSKKAVQMEERNGFYQKNYTKSRLTQRAERFPEKKSSIEPFGTAMGTAFSKKFEKKAVLKKSRTALRTIIEKKAVGRRRAKHIDRSGERNASNIQIEPSRGTAPAAQPSRRKNRESKPAFPVLALPSRRRVRRASRTGRRGSPGTRNS